MLRHVLHRGLLAASAVSMMATGLISKLQDGVKILAFGELDKKLKVSAHKFSAQAKAKIEKAGGEVTIL